MTHYQFRLRLTTKKAQISEISDKEQFKYFIIDEIKQTANE